MGVECGPPQCGDPAVVELGIAVAMGAPAITATLGEGLVGLGQMLKSPRLFTAGMDLLAEATATSAAVTRIAEGDSAPTADFYVRPNGEVIPARGYRYVSSEAPYLDNLLNEGTIPANSDGTYFSFDKMDDAAIAAGRLQVPHDATIRVEFNTLQILDNIRIPYGKWGTSAYLEPITFDFPQFGPGGATQAITTLPIQSFRIVNIETGDVLYELR